LTFDANEGLLILEIE